MLKIDCDLKDIIIQSLRYALYRHTYALNQTCEYIRNHTEILDERVVQAMLEDIKERLAVKDLAEYERATIKCLQIILENWKKDKE